MQHIEQHFSGSDTVRDVVIGMADGLTVPFALAGGISGALTSTHIVVTAGIAAIAAGSIAGSYIIGGLVPLAPYIQMHDSGRALMVSAAITLLALAAFGFVKGHFTGVPKTKSAAQTALIGSLAAGVAYALAKLIA